MLLTEPSHKTTRAGGKVTVHGVELFAGFDAGIHSENKQMQGYTRSVMAEIASGTLAMMSRGLFPRIAVSHLNSQHEGALLDDRPCVGRVTGIRLIDRAGTPVIVGDMEYAEADFDELVGSNRYPSRSAELFENPPRIGAVALLGGDTPRSPVADTLFNDIPTAVIASDKQTNFSAGIGGGMPVSPTYEQETEMTDELKAEIMSMCKAAFSELIAEREKTRSEKTDEEEKEDKTDMSESVRSELAKRDERIATLERERRVDFSERKMAEFSAKRLSIPAHRAEEIKTWLATVGPEEGEKIAALIGDLCAGASPTRRIDMSQAAPNSKRVPSKGDIDKAVAAHAGDPKGYLKAIEAIRNG